MRLGGRCSRCFTRAYRKVILTTPISNIQYLVAVMRDEITNQALSVAGQSATSLKRLSTRNSHTLTSKRDIASSLRKRIRSINPDDPDKERKAFRIFIESMLLQELGMQLINDPQFYDLVDKVHEQMEANNEIADLVRIAVAQLFAPT